MCGELEAEVGELSTVERDLVGWWNWWTPPVLVVP